MRHIRFLIHEIRFFRDVDRAPFRIVAKKKKERKEKKVTSRSVEAPALLQGSDEGKKLFLRSLGFNAFPNDNLPFPFPNY